MSVRVSDKLFYFLPQTNKSNLSTSLPQFTKDTNSFEIASIHLDKQRNSYFLQ